MSIIQLLDESTINQIAAGEVVERPSAVVKELIENAMDAGATAITCEIKEGGLSFIRITDNGQGIDREDIPLAFLRHATSKIKTAEDLLSVRSLGFRGEALSSIAAVSQVELITKSPDALLGYRYLIEGGEEKSLEEIGCPSGTTILVRNLFYNTPARRKFLKSPNTETGYVSDLIERLMVSHPNISFKFIVNNQVKLQSAGNNNTKDILYHVYGREVAKELIPVEYKSERLSIIGFIAKPTINRGNRNYENYFINGRYIKSSVIIRAIEEAYKPYMMQHKYPFTSLYYEINPEDIDVNVHPQKLEVRLKTGDEVYDATFQLIKSALGRTELIPSVSLTKEEQVKEKIQGLPEPFEKQRRNQLEALKIMAAQKPVSYTYENNKTQGQEGFNLLASKGDSYDTRNNLTELASMGKSFNLQNATPVSIDSIKTTTEANSYSNSLDSKITTDSDSSEPSLDIASKTIESNPMEHSTDTNANSEMGSFDGQDKDSVQVLEQLTLFKQADEAAPFISDQGMKQHRIIGQVFQTYWLIEYGNEMYIIDQHAAHEKVLYERIMAAAKNRTYASQRLMPPIVLTLSLKEQETLLEYQETLESIGYEFEHFGGNEYSVRAVPANLYGLSEKTLLLEFIDSLTDEITGGLTDTNSILEKTATLSCKAAVKANHVLSYQEAESLIKELLTLENPYHCPHGRPVIISMSRYEMEKKFRRIV